MPLDVVVEFKRGVYEMALTELARYLPRQDQRNRYLRSGMRARDGEHAHGNAHAAPALRTGSMRATPRWNSPLGRVSIQIHKTAWQWRQFTQPSSQKQEALSEAATRRNAIMNKPLPEQTPASAFFMGTIWIG